jgi:hypothetical protein
VGDLSIPDLAQQQIEKLYTVAEAAARKHVLSKVPRVKIKKLNISVEAEGTRPMNLEIDADVDLSHIMKNFDVQQLVDEAVKEGFKSAERYLRELACHLRK